DRVFMTLNDDDQAIEVLILSTDKQRQLTATIDKNESYHILLSYLTDENEFLQQVTVFDSKDRPIYVPVDEVMMQRKTIIANKIDPELFINALFRNPSLVTRNIREAYFTDGQRGMRVAQDNLRLEYINPIQANYERLSPFDLIDKSVMNINEHKGWVNNYTFDGINRNTNNIRYRLTYDGYTVFDHNQLSIIEQEWRNQELYKYSRP